MTAPKPATGETDAALRPARDDLFRAVGGGIELRQDAELQEGDGRTLFGHFARFDTWTEIDSFFEGRFLERIAPGAFKKTFRERTPKVLFNHGFDELGRMALGEIEELREDGEGAYYEVRLFDGLPELLMDGLRADQYGSSFRFKVMRESLVAEPQRSDHNPDGLPERTIREAQVFEFGPVTFPAYEDASAGVRSITDTIIFGRLARDPAALARLIEFRDQAAAIESPAEKEEAREASDAPPKDSAGTESHPARGRRVTAGPLYGSDDHKRKEPSWRLP